MQTCSNCGATVRERARFCTACGTQLNDASSGSSPFSWGAAIEQSAPQSTEVTTTGWPGTATNGSAQVGESDTAEHSGWNWGIPGESPAAEEVDEESGIILDDPDEVAISGVVDATELEVLEAKPEDNEPDVIDESAPDLSMMEDEAMSATPEDAADSPGDQDTIAALAQEWSSEESVSSTSAPTTSEDDDDDDPEVTMAKAERLISELQSLVPRLARPKPADPNQTLLPKQLADELDSATGEADWEDLREILVQARDNPNDITYLVRVSGNAGRLLELMEHRDSLVNTASRVASRLRNPEAETQA